MRLPSVAESRAIFSVSSVPSVLEHVLEGLQPRGEHVAAPPRRGCRSSVDQRLGAVAEGVGDVVAARDHACRLMRAPVCSILATTSPPRSRQVQHQRIAGVAQRVVDLFGAAGDRVGQPVAGLA